MLVYCRHFYMANEMKVMVKLTLIEIELVVWHVKVFMAGLPALHGSESGQVRKEAATAIFCKCRGFGSPPQFLINPDLNFRGYCQRGTRLFFPFIH